MTKVKETLFWYDLETSGTDPRRDHIMQFAGQRTDMDLNLIGEPVNVMIKFPEDKLPQPDAVLITGITPQMTRADGLTEVEFLHFFTDEVAVPGTIFVGYNSVRFDDEFMRFLHYRSYFDAYGWQWRDNRSRWDLLDVIRMTRALRPNGIVWPVDQGKPTNRLELITKSNGIVHDSAHDALSDVLACIDVARLVRDRQPKLFDYLLTMRDKKKVATLVEAGEAFVYTSGKYPGEFEKTTVAVRISANPHAQGSLVYDVRIDPTEFIGMTPAELADRWRWTRDDDAPTRLPIKTLQYNRCPAVAPFSVLDAVSQERLHIDPEMIQYNLAVLTEHPDLAGRVLEALEILESERQGKWAQTGQAEERLYDGFVDDADQTLMSVLRAATPEEIMRIGSDFHDARLRDMLLAYKARNFSTKLTDEERAAWEKHRYEALMSGGADSSVARYMHRLSELAPRGTDGDIKYLLDELQLYGESILPSYDQ